jgi:hypothetical protein
MRSRAGNVRSSGVRPCHHPTEPSSIWAWCGRPYRTPHRPARTRRGRRRHRAAPPRRAWPRRCRAASRRPAAPRRAGRATARQPWRQPARCRARSAARRRPRARGSLRLHRRRRSRGPGRRGRAAAARREARRRPRRGRRSGGAARGRAKDGVLGRAGATRRSRRRRCDASRPRGVAAPQTPRHTRRRPARARIAAPSSHFHQNAPDVPAPRVRGHLQNSLNGAQAERGCDAVLDDVDRAPESSQSDHCVTTQVTTAAAARHDWRPTTDARREPPPSPRRP